MIYVGGSSYKVILAPDNYWDCALHVPHYITGTSTAASETITLQFVDAVGGVTTETLVMPVTNGSFSYKYKDKQIYSLSDAFYGKTSVTSVAFDEDMSKCVSFYNSTTDRGSFEGCSNLVSVSFPNDATLDSVVTMRQAFKDCSSLTSFDFILNRSLAGLTDATSLFQNCTSIASGYPTSLLPSLEHADYMLAGCTGMTNEIAIEAVLDNLITADSMFRGCSGMTNAFIFPNATFENLESCSGMFLGCSRVLSIYLESANMCSIVGTSASDMFYECNSLVDLALPPVSLGYYFSGTSLNLAKTSLDASYYLTSSDGNLFDWLGVQGGSLKISSSIGFQQYSNIRSRFSQKNWTVSH